jgi:hypothetical protein
VQKQCLLKHRHVMGRETSSLEKIAASSRVRTAFSYF